MKFLLIALTICFVGCGTTTDRQTKTVERVTTQTGPITIDIPMVGQAVVQPTTVTVNREVYEVEQERQTIDMPNVTPLIQAAASGTPFGAILGTVLGFGGIAGALHQMLGKKKAERRFGEVVDSVEMASEDMTDKQWEEFSGKFSHSPETKAAIKARLAKKGKV